MEDSAFKPMELFSQRTWLNLIFILALSGIVIINFVTYREIDKFNQSNNWVIHTYKVITATNCILINLLNAESLTRAYALTGDKTFIQGFNVKLETTRQYLAIAQSLTTDNPRQAERLFQMKALLEQRFSYLQKIIAKKENNQLNDASTNELVKQGQIITNNITQTLEEFNDRELRLLNKRNEIAYANLHNIGKFNAAASIADLILLVIILLLFNRQLTYRVYSEKKRRESETILRGIVNGTNDFIAAIDLNFRYLIFNKSYEQEFKQIFGKQIVVGTKIHDALSHLTQKPEELLNNWNKALHGETFTVQVEYGDPNIERNLYEVTYNPILDENGNIIGAANLGRNVTKRIEKETETKIINRELQEAYRELKLHDTNVTLLNEMETSLQACSSIDETFNIIANCCKKLLPFASGILYLMNNSRSYLEPVAEWSDPAAKAKIFAPDQCWALRHGKLYKFFDKNHDAECKHQVIENVHPTYLCVPLQAHNEIIGVLYLEIKRHTMFSAAELNDLVNHNLSIINNLAGQISLSLANIRLKDTLKVRSIRDSLTGLYNRSYLNESIERDLQRAKRSNAPLTFVMVDLDNFKIMNDTYGHEAGDYILKQIGICLQNQVRSSDIACRYGGEEFLIAFYDTGLKEGVARTEKIQTVISQMELSIAGKTLPTITASFGISIFPEDGDDVHRLIDKADQALYQSKKAGRNRITVFDKSLF